MITKSRFDGQFIFKQIVVSGVCKIKFLQFDETNHKAYSYDKETKPLDLQTVGLGGIWKIRLYLRVTIKKQNPSIVTTNATK